jgi:hypothetical protein
VTSTRRRVRRCWPAALAMATVANLALLSLLAFPGGYRLQFGADASRPVDVTLAPWPVLRAPAPRKAPAQRSSGPTHATTASPPEASTIAATPQTVSPPAEGPAGALPPNADLATALRRSLVGCANQGAAWVSDADRDACRQRLADGAASVPHLQGMAQAKLNYYAAVAKAEEDWRTGRDPGHLPFLFCGVNFGQGRPGIMKPGPHALKLGPCFLEPPKGALSQDVDVPPP